MAFDLPSLTRAGFEQKLTTEQWQERNKDLDERGMNSGGPYVSNYVLKKRVGGGEVTVTVEQNTSTENQSGMEVTIKHPEIVVVEGPGGRAVCAAGNTYLILQLAKQLAQAPREG
jgi:co-chaperonin GroES (HSP10)